MSESGCTHRHAGDWAIGLQHNFPDYLPRGICLLCGLVIHPMHWGQPTPHRTDLIPAHPLYPVVLLSERLEFALLLLDDEYTKQVDTLLADSQRQTKIFDAEIAHQQARQKLIDQFHFYTQQDIPAEKTK